LLVELLPRVGSPRFPVNVFGPGFTLCIVNAGGGLHVFLESTVSPETFSRFYGVKRASYRNSYLWLLTTQQISIMMRNCTAHSSSMAPLLETPSDGCGCEEERAWLLGNVTSYSLTVNTTTA
jgi:hypothetical protein